MSRDVHICTYWLRPWEKTNRDITAGKFSSIHRLRLFSTFTICRSFRPCRWANKLSFSSKNIFIRKPITYGWFVNKIYPRNCFMHERTGFVAAAPYWIIIEPRSNTYCFLHEYTLTYYSLNGLFGLYS
jgi:hypothetical protein